MSDERIRDGAIRKTLDDFTGGYNLYSDPSKIRENEFQIFENLIINKAGRFLNATKREGFWRWNKNRTVTTENINSIFEIVWKTKELENRILVKTATSLEYVIGATNSFNKITDVNSESKMKALMYKDAVYIANNDNGDSANAYYDGDNYMEIGCPPAYQQQELSLSTQASTVLGTGIYQYLIVFLYDDNMESGVVLRHTATNADVNTIATVNINVTELFIPNIDNSTQKKINISAIPVGNERVTGRVIYRTESDGDRFYYLATIKDNTTTVFLNDNVPDTDLGAEYNGGDGFVNILKPYKSKYHVVHQGRIWQANLKENQYEIPDISEVTINSQAGTSHISADAARGAYYSYKFAKDIRIIKGKTFSGTAANVVPPYTGIFGKLTDAIRMQTTATHTENYIDLLPTGGDLDDFAKRTAIFRNCCQFISGISVAGTTLTVTVGAANVFKEGETVSISGVAGFSNDINGDYAINTVTATTFKITSDTGGGTYTASSGVAEGSEFYLCGFTKGTSFTDGYADTYMTGLGFSIDTSNGDKSFKSSVISSEADQPDIFPPGNFMNLGQDNGEEIMGIFSDSRRLIVFKENSIYEIDTTYQDTSFARARKVVNDIGAKSGYAIVQTSNNEFIFLGGDGFFYHWRGAGIPQQISLKIQPDIDGLEFTNIDGCYYPKLRSVIFTYSVTGSDGNVLIYDMSISDGNGAGVWYHFKKFTYSLNLCAPFITKDRDLIFGNRAAGYIMKYGGFGYDNLLTAGTVTFSNVPICIKITTKLFKDLISVKKIFARIHTNGAGATDGLSVIYGTDTETPVSKTLTTGLNIIDIPINKKGREFYFRLENADDVEISIKEIGMEYLPIHKPGEI